MENTKTFFRTLRRGLLVVIAMCATLGTGYAGGIQDLVPQDSSEADSPVMLLINRANFGRFASPGADANSRLYFTIANDGENINIRLSELYDQLGRSRGNNNGQYTLQVKDANENPILIQRGAAAAVSQLTITNATRNATNFADAEFDRGNNNITNAGALAPGEYYIEFAPVGNTATSTGNIGVDGTSLNIRYWDFTVSGANDVAIPGRVWSRNWAFRTPPDIDDLNSEQCIWNRNFNGAVYSHTGSGDSPGMVAPGFVSEIDFNGSGFKGLSFNLSFNSRGPGIAGPSIEEARQSVPDNLATPAARAGIPEYRVFLEVPDTDVFPIVDGCAEVTFLEEPVRCTDVESICFPVNIGGPGQAELILDFDGNLEYDPATEDIILLYVFDEAVSDTCLAWDRRDGLGNLVTDGSSFNLIVRFGQGVQHFSAFDVEEIADGFCVNTVLPDETNLSCLSDVPQDLLYYNDTLLMNIDPFANPPANVLDGLAGTQCGPTGTRRWDNFVVTGATCTVNANGNGVGNTGSQSGYGEDNLLNTWWYAQLDTFVRRITLMDIVIVGPNPVCVGTETNLAATVNGGTGPFTFVWNGPGGFTTTDSILMVSTPGIYTVDVTDAVGCMSSDTIDVSFDGAITCTVEGPDEICFGETADYAAVPDSGSAPFTFVWTGPDGFTSTDSVITISVGGEYCALITDAGGCETECCRTLTVIGDDLSCAVTGPSLICPDETATLTAVPTGGEGPYTFAWTLDEDPSVISTAATIVVGASGEYCALITDANGCVTECCQTLAVSPEINIAFVADSISVICPGDSITYAPIVTGGTPPLGLSWAGPGGFTSADNIITVDAAGEYCLTVTDDADCTTTRCRILQFSPEINITFGQDSLTLICEGDNLTYDPVVNGGTQPLTQIWTGPNGFTSTDNLITVDEAGEYCLTVTDDAGCVTTRCRVLDFFPDLSCEVTGPSSICTGQTAALAGVPSGGPGPYTFAWTVDDSTLVISTDSIVVVSTTGEYCVTITDGNGCTTSCCQTLEVLEELVCTVVGPTEICEGESATYTVSIPDATPPLTYAWTGPDGFTSTEESITVDVAGEYCAMVTDANGCTSMCCVDLTISDGLSCAVTGPETICAGDTTTYGVDVEGGVEPFTYAWTGPDGLTATTEAIEISDEGEYCVTVTDANGCETECCQTLSFFPEITIEFDGPEGNAICFGDSATYNAIVTNAAEPFTIAWTGPDDFSSTDLSITVTEGGEYCAEVTDANGCMAEACVTLSVSEEIFCSVEGPEEICPGDEATFTVAIEGGVAPFTFVWSGPNDFTSTDPTVTVTEPGTYGVTLTDANGCMSVCEDLTLSVFEDAPTGCTVQGPEVICEGETATYSVDVEGGVAPFEFMWTGPGGFTSAEASPTVNESGEYCVTVTDANGCTTNCCQTLSVVTVDVSLSATDTEIIFGTSTTLTANASGCTNCVYVWSGPNGPINANGPTIDVTPMAPLPDNGEYTYTVTVSEDGECPATATITIRVINECDPDRVYLPNAFTPNNDGLNDVLFVETLTPELYETGTLFMIYNRWGEEVFLTEDITQGWDGTFRDEALPPDVYGFYLKVVCPDGNDLIQKGNITILR